MGQPDRCPYREVEEGRAVYQPSAWMNQVEIWLGILVRKLLKCGNFITLNGLRDQILAFTDYYNRTMAKPIKSRGPVRGLANRGDVYASVY